MLWLRQNNLWSYRNQGLDHERRSIWKAELSPLVGMSLNASKGKKINVLAEEVEEESKALCYHLRKQNTGKCRKAV